MLRAPVRRGILGISIATSACGGSPTPAAGSSETTAVADTTSDGSTASCEGFQSASEIGPAVTVTVRHDGGQPVFFVPRTCAGVMGVEVMSLDQDVLVPNVRSDCTPELCDEFMTASDCFPGCPDCAPPGAARIEPGGTVTGEWSGTWLVPLEMNRDCVVHDSCEATCQRADQAPPGRYTVGLTIYRTCEGGCGCEEGDDAGTCNLWGGTFLAYPQTFVAQIDYPNVTSAEVVIVD
jgi:hypothetical protein